MVNFFLQTKSIGVYLLLGWIAAPVKELLNKYVFDDWDYLRFLLVLICVDTALGFYKAILEKKISPEGFGQILKKFIIYFAALICGHVLSTFTVSGSIQTGFGYLNNVIYCAVIIKESISLFKNIAKIDPGVFPDKIISLLEGFENHPIKKKKDEENTIDTDVH